MAKVKFGKMFLQPTGPTVPVVFHKGRLCPYVVLNTKRTRKYSGLHLIEGDLEFAIDAMFQCRQLPQNRAFATVKRSLWLASLVTYAKCFTASSGRRVTLNEKDVLRKATKLQIECHADMMQTRHQYVAHAGKCDEQQGKLLLVLEPDRADKKVLNFATLALSALSADAAYLDRCIEVMRLVLTQVREDFTKAEKALRLEIDGVPVDDWYAKAVPRVREGSITMFPKSSIRE